MLVVYIFVGLIFLFFLSMFVLALCVHIRFFYRRYEGNSNLKYLEAKDFESLEAEPVFFCSNNHQGLQGFIYKKTGCSDPIGCIIFSHGFGAGHRAYTTEINFFAQAGFYVLAYDSTACADSDGKYFGGFDQGPIDLEAALRFSCENAQLKDLKKVIVGHSWGGFSVMNCVNTDVEISGAVAMCGFISGASIMAQSVAGRLKFLKPVLTIDFRLLNKLKFGKDANKNSIRSLKHSECPIFLLYGKLDRTVKFPDNGAKILQRVRHKSNIKYKICSDKGHNVYLSVQAEQYMAKTFGALSRKEKHDKERKKNFYSSIDYGKLTEEDPVIMNEILNFCLECI